MGKNLDNSLYRSECDCNDEIILKDSNNSIKKMQLHANKIYSHIYTKDEYRLSLISDSIISLLKEHYISSKEFSKLYIDIKSKIYD